MPAAAASSGPRLLTIVVGITVCACVVLIFQLTPPSMPPVVKGVITNLGSLEEDWEIRNGAGSSPSKPVRRTEPEEDSPHPPEVPPGTRGAEESIPKKGSDFASVDNKIKPKNNNPTNATVSSLRAYTHHIHTLLVDELGLELATALYDPHFLNDAITYIDVADRPATTSATKEPYIDPHSIFLVEKGLDWAFRTVLYAPGNPAPMATVPTRLVLLKQVTSLGIGRLARDGRLAESWAAGDTFGSSGAAGDSARLAYNRPLRAAIRGFASYAISYLQVLIDGEKRMPDMAEWAKNANNNYNRANEGERYTDVKDPIVRPHLDPLISLLQVIKVGPGSTSTAIVEDDAALGAMLRQSRRLRMAAEGLIGKAIGQADPSGITRGANGELTAVPDVLSALSSVMQKSTTAGAFRPILEAYKASKDTTTITGPAALIDVIGYATALWESRIASVSAMAEAPIEEGAERVAASNAVSSRAQYALQYFTNSDYGKWNVHLRNGRFWNSIRPVVGCSALSKLCEEPDGCRYLCNLNYLLMGEPQKPTDSGQYAHQAVGFGSNNEYDWELGLVDTFKRGAAAVVGKASMPNTIGRITVFDCTLKKWTPPSFLSEGNVGFGHASYCLGLKDVSPLPRIREALGDGKDGVAVVGFNSIRKFINSDGLYPSNYFERDNSQRPANPFLKRFPVLDRIAKNSQSAVVVHSSAADDVLVPSPLYVDYRTYDEVSIIKFDVEGFEHSSFPSFLRAELEDLHAHFGPNLKKIPADGWAFPLIFFDTDAPDSLTIGQLGMEFHRQGHKGPTGSSYAGAMRAHYTLMQLVSKGFLMFAQEKNPVDYCCYEIALSHYRHYVRSEVWQSV